MINLKEKLLGGWLGQKILTEGRVREVETLGASYRRISVEAPALRGKVGGPGDKVQVFLPGVGTRTYSPFAWERSAGSFQLLAYLHGQGPGSAWARGVGVGDDLRFLGPDGSLAFPHMEAPVAFLGDETSLAVARTLVDAHGEQAMVTIEVDDMDAAREACARIGLPGSALVPRASGGDVHVLAQRLAAWSGPGGTVVLTGSAQTIQRVRAGLRELDRRPLQKTRAYWSLGKVGLD